MVSYCDEDCGGEFFSEAGENSAVSDLGRLFKVLAAVVEIQSVSQQILIESLPCANHSLEELVKM